MKMIVKLKQWINCHVFGMHEWTCAAEENIEPTKEQLSGIQGFWDYATMYCKHCKKESEISESRKQ